MPQKKAKFVFLCFFFFFFFAEQWEEAHKDFFEAFKNYDEAGSTRRIQCLKYLVLANVLLKSGIDPFTAQETKPYKNDPEITAMNNLLIAINHDDIFEFERILGGTLLFILLNETKQNKTKR